MIWPSLGVGALKASGWVFWILWLGLGLARTMLCSQAVIVVLNGISVSRYLNYDDDREAYQNGLANLSLTAIQRDHVPAAPGKE